MRLPRLLWTPISGSAAAGRPLGRGASETSGEANSSTSDSTMIESVQSTNSSTRDGVPFGPLAPPKVSSSAISADEREASFAETIVAEDRGWRSLISGGMRELTWAQIIENLNNATLAYRTNPLAYRLVALAVDHVLGDGMKLVASDPEIQRELSAWWNHPLNNLDVRQFDMLTALMLDGELFVSEHVNPYDLSSYLRLVPAALIDRIETNPDDLEDELRFHQTAQPMTPDTLMRMPSALQAEGRWWDATEMVHFAVNRPAGVVRGQSDLAPLLPWLRRYRDWLLDRVRLNKYRTAFLWHVTLTGADRRAVIARQNELAEPPNPGSIIVSNEKEVWTAVQPDIKASDVEQDGLALRLMIAAGAGVPLFWLAEAEHTARGTAGEMAEPTLRHFRQRQLYFGWAMRRLAVRALHRRGLTAVTLGDVTAEFSELDQEDTSAVGANLGYVAQAIQLAQQSGWVDADEAAELWAHFVGELSAFPSSDPSGSTRRTAARRGAKAEEKSTSEKTKNRFGSHPRKPFGSEFGPEDPEPQAREPLPQPFFGGGISGQAAEPIVRV